MDRIEIKPYDYGRQTERRRQARRRARRRAFFLAAAELAAGVCMTMAVMAMVIPEKRELGMAGTEQGLIKQDGEGQKSCPVYWKTHMSCKVP